MKKLQTIIKKLGAFESVETMQSVNGNDVPNQFILHFEKGCLFQSYRSIIAVKLNGCDTVYLSEHWDYSNTTNKYRNMFCNDNTTDIRKYLEGKRVDTYDKYELVQGC